MADKGARFLFITGLSGSGKTAAMKVLEDTGFFCVDNLPAKLIFPFAKLTASGGEQIDRVAIVADLRERGFVKDFPDVYRRLYERGFSTSLIFFEATEEILVRRFSESRRPHPLQIDGGSLLEAVRAEKQELELIRQLADAIIDTSKMSVHELKRHLLERFAEGERTSGPAIQVMSFGFKYGVPQEADLVFDVRFLPNPYFEPNLRDKDGNDADVESFLLAQEVTNDFLSRLNSFVDYLLPLYTAEGKSYLTIAIGCTGGRHRSVMIGNQLAKGLRAGTRSVKLSHRDVEQG